MTEKTKKGLPHWAQLLIGVLLSSMISLYLFSARDGWALFDRPSPEEVASVSVYWYDGEECHTAEFSDAEHIKRACTQLGLLRYNPLVPVNKAGLHLEPEVSIVFQMTDGTSRELEACRNLFSWNGKFHKHKAEPTLFFDITDVYYFNDTFAKRALP